MHEIVFLAKFAKTARTLPFTVINAIFLAIFAFLFKKLAFKRLNDQILLKRSYFMLRYGSRSYNIYALKKGIKCIFGTLR
jgi:hypothetical protein